MVKIRSYLLSTVWHQKFRCLRPELLVQADLTVGDSVQADLTVVRDSVEANLTVVRDSVPPKLPITDRKWILTREGMRKSSCVDFWSWTGTSGHGSKLPVIPEVFCETRAHLSLSNRNFLSRTETSCQANWNFPSCIFSTIWSLCRLLTLLTK